MEKNCKNCKYEYDGTCMVPIYIDADFFAGQEVGEENACYLWEEKTDVAH